MVEKTGEKCTNFARKPSDLGRGRRAESLMKEDLDNYLASSCKSNGDVEDGHILLFFGRRPTLEAQSALTRIKIMDVGELAGILAPRAEPTNNTPFANLGNASEQNGSQNRSTRRTTSSQDFLY